MSIVAGRIIGRRFASNPLQGFPDPRTYFTYSREPAHYLAGKVPAYLTADEALGKVLQSDSTVFAQGAAATPLHLLTAMSKKGKEKKLSNIRVVHMHTEGNAPYHEPEYKDIFRSFSLFMGGNVRTAVAEGRADALPIFLQDIPSLFSKKIIEPDVALIQVSPPDKHGFCSLGTSVDCVRAALIASKVIVAQINKHMPRTFGDSIIHIGHVDFAVEMDMPISVHGVKEPTDVEAKIGKFIAEELVENGATLQMGIGNIPDAVLSSLTGHQDLGVHSEMFSDGVVDLVNVGAITNNKKTRHKGRIVGSFLVGSQKLYDFVHDNPLIEMLSIDYVNSTRVISTQPRMTAINSAIEVDITGQVCADSIGTRMFSGFGGQVDFIRGASESIDGKGVPIIALPSATKKGVSKIVSTIQPGAGVVTSRAHIRYLVTEYGVAYLFGKSLRQRAHAIIGIAHPDHRERLEKEAFERYKCMPSP